MPLYALTDADEIAAAYQRLTERLREGAVPYECTVGWQGGGGVYPVYWQPVAGIWGLSNEEPEYYWFGFGTDDPAPTNSVGDVVVQFGFVRDGKSPKRAGIFARDEQGTLHLAHSGGVGGGRTGIGRNAFLDAYNGRFAYIYWSKYKATRVEYIIIGPLEAPDLMENIGAFVRSVKTFKEKATTKR